MTAHKRLIEVDEATAESLESQASARGVSVAQLLAEFAASKREMSDDIAELDRRWISAKNGAPAAHEKVVRWLRTWGTSEFRPWREQ
jgi:hypothetical protein